MGQQINIIVFLRSHFTKRDQRIQVMFLVVHEKSINRLPTVAGSVCAIKVSCPLEVNSFLNSAGGTN